MVRLLLPLGSNVSSIYGFSCINDQSV